MSTYPGQFSGRGRAGFAALERDAALGRIRRVRGWAIAGSAALTAALAALASALLPGRSLPTSSHHAAATQASGPSPSVTPRLPPAASGGALGLQGPEQAPQAATGTTQRSAPAQSSPPQASASDGAVSGGS